MAFNSRKFQKLIEAEMNNTDFTDDFEDDFGDDFDEAPAEAPVEDIIEFVPEEEPAPEAPADEPVVEEPIAEEPAEEIIEEAPAEETPAEEEPEVIAAPIVEEPVAEEPAAEEYSAQNLWQNMAALAVKAKECITAGAFFRANEYITAMRSLLAEMMCRANGINENFTENVDNLSEDCKQDLYTSYVSTLNAQSLSNAVTNIMAVTYKYI